jgi:hypothetical protein
MTSYQVRGSVFQLSSTVTDKDVVTLPSNYRKIRAISTAVLQPSTHASETILILLRLVQNIREEKYAKMGAEPLKDMLMSMRFRSKLMKNSFRQSKKANELENTITSC